MELMGAYVVPVSSLRFGRNTLNYELDWRFFGHFEQSPVQQGRFQVALVFDRYQDHWHLQFEISGDMDTECDRCLAPIALPVSGSYELYVKFDEEESGEEGPEVIYVPRESTQLDIAQIIYEFVVLSVPLTKRYACEETEPRPCDVEMLARLEAGKGNKTNNPQWDVLKEIRISGEGMN